VLLRGGRGLLPECALQQEYFGHNLGENCLEDTGPCGALPNRARGCEGALAPSCCAQQGHGQIEGILVLIQKKKIKFSTCAGRKSKNWRLATLESRRNCHKWPFRRVSAASRIKEKNAKSPGVCSIPCGVRQLGARHRAPMGGAPFHQALRSLVVRETWLLGPVSPRMPISKSINSAPEASW